MGIAEELAGAGTTGLAKSAFAEENLTNNEHVSTSTSDVEKQPNGELEKIQIWKQGHLAKTTLLTAAAISLTSTAQTIPKIQSIGHRHTNGVW